MAAVIFIRSSPMCFFVLVVLITYQEIQFTKGRHLNSMETKVISPIEGGRRMMQDSGSRIVERITKVVAKPSHNTHFVKRDTVLDERDSKPQSAAGFINKAGSTVEPISAAGYETTLSDAGKYYPDSTQQGHSPGVGHPFVSSKLDAHEIKEQTNVAAGKTHDYSPGVGHSVPTKDGYVKREIAGGDGGASVVADKRNAKAGKSDDYSPGVGHSIRPDGSDNKHAIGVAMRNNKYLSDEKVIDHHSPGVGHSIQEKHAEPRARK